MISCICTSSPKHSAGVRASAFGPIYLGAGHEPGRNGGADSPGGNLPTGLPTEQRQYDHNEGKAREIKQLTDSARACNNGA
jgi:hypothetical protein